MTLLDIFKLKPAPVIGARFVSGIGIHDAPREAMSPSEKAIARRLAAAKWKERNRERHNEAERRRRAKQ